MPRDIDDGLRERLAAGGFVLLGGDSTAGKSRAAFEAEGYLGTGGLTAAQLGRLVTGDGHHRGLETNDSC